MKKMIPFDFFEQGQTIYFNTSRFEELENLTGKSVGDLMNVTMSVVLLVSALQVGLQHHYGKKSRQFYQDKIDQYEGSSVDLWREFTKAIMVSGIFGKEVADAVIENKPIKEVDEKNALRTE